MKNKENNKFKSSPIGPIPEDWDSIAFSDAVTFNPKRQIKKRQQVKFVAMTDLSSFNKKIDSYSFREFFGGAKFKNGDTLMARITPCLENGKTSYVDILENHEIGGGSTEFIVLSGKDGVTDSSYVYYLSVSPEIRSAAIQAMTGTSGRQRVETDKLASYMLKLPPLPTQRRIAEILSSLDDKIELNRKMNKTLESIAQAMFKRWFVDFEFPFDFSQGKPYKSSGGKMVESELGAVPEGWGLGTFGEAVSILDSKRIPLSKKQREQRKGHYPYYGATSVVDYVDGYLFDGVYVLLGEDGSVARDDGSPFVQYVYGKIWVNNHAHVLEGKNGFSTEFVKLFLNQTEITPYVTGAVQPKLNQENMKAIPLVIPPQKTLVEFNSFVQPIYKQIVDMEEQSRTISQIRELLLPRLMSGKIRTAK